MAITKKDTIKYGSITDVDLGFHELSKLRTQVFGLKLVHKRLSKYIHRVKIYTNDDHVATLYMHNGYFGDGKVKRYGVNSLFKEGETFREGDPGVVVGLRVDLHRPALVRHVEANLGVRRPGAYELSLKISLQPKQEMGRYLIAFDLDDSSEIDGPEDLIHPESIFWLNWAR